MLLTGRTLPPKSSASIFRQTYCHQITRNQFISQSTASMVVPRTSWCVPAVVDTDKPYVEVADVEAARKILKLRQNSPMPGGPLTAGRKRPVTITSVPLSELVNEVSLFASDILTRFAHSQLRPRCAAELHGLLALCEAAVTCPQLIYPAHPTMTSLVAPTGLTHFVKSRHGPFYNVMSILTKLRGRDSPAYWDVFRERKGSILLLMSDLASGEAYSLSTDQADKDLQAQSRLWL
jgi:hypothetical protein